MAREILTEFDATTRPWDAAVDRIDRRLGRFNTDVSRRLDRFDQRFERSARAVRGLGRVIGAVLGAQAERGLSGLADASTRVSNRLAAMGETSDAARAALFRLSVETRSSFEGNATVVQRFVKSTGDAYAKNLRRVETLNKLFASAGTGQSERDSTLTQFSQGLQSGFLQGDELKSLRENAPVELLQALAREAGVTFEELKAAGADGKLTLDVMTRAVDSLGETADEAFKKVRATSSEAFGVLRTGLIEFVGAANDGAGATDALAAAMIDVGGFLGEGKDAAEAFGQALSVLGQFALTVAGARGLGRLNTAIRSTITARQEAVAVGQAEVAAARADVASAQQRLVTAAARERQVRVTTNSVAALTKAETSSARARAALATVLGERGGVVAEDQVGIDGVDDDPQPFCLGEGIQRVAVG